MGLFDIADNFIVIPKVMRARAKEHDEWYTPVKYIEAARKVMGSIDLDPASCEFANQIVKATTYFDTQSDGFDKDWKGRIWLNPPYSFYDGRSNQERWSQRLIYQYRAGITSEAILMVNASTGYHWFDALWEYTICFTHGRVKFYTKAGIKGLASIGSAIVYFGPHEQKFIEVFRKFGRIARAIDEPEEKPINLELWTA